MDAQIAWAERYFRAGQTKSAEPLLRQIVAKPNPPSKAYELLAYICGNRGETQACEEYLTKAAKLPKCSPECLFYLGRVQLQSGRAREATTSFERSLKAGGDFFEALHELGVAHAALHEDERAVAAFRRAERKNPRSPLLLHNLANALTGLEHFNEALDCYDRALALEPDRAAAWSDRGSVLTRLGRGLEALQSYDRALALDPGNVAVLEDHATSLLALRRYPQALAAYEALAKVAPDSDYLPGHLLHLRMHECIWQDWERDTRALLARVGQGERVATPFSLMGTPADAATLLACARTFAESRYPARDNDESAAANAPPGDASRKLRIAYFCADFRNHATSQLMVRLFECHDRTRFEWFGYSLDRGESDGLGRRVSEAFDHFIEVGDRSDAEIAGMAREAGIDIAVDLNGFTQGFRAGIFAHRAAPLQINYLGFPGTMGCTYMDYLIADPRLIRSGEEALYTEKVVRLPESYQANDNTKRIAQSLPSREAMGLPTQGFVFACFNNSFKLTPDVFDVWMRLLRDVPSSVLWLLAGSERMQAEIAAQAQARGVASERIVWAGRAPLADHLARHAHADLFLDTFHCNAHTTCSDALWAGLPVLTLEGSTFPARVASSLLHAAGLAELVTHSVADYEAAARRLANNPQERAGLRDRLRAERDRMPLFDTPRFARHIEAAYEAMAQRRRNGLEPDHLWIEALPN